MNRRQNEIEGLMLEYEKQCVKDLQKTYTKALADVKIKLRELLGRDQTQSVAYQIEFQRTLESQLQNAIDTLKSGSITSVTDFLNKTYEDGYLGTIYSIQGQGIPINIGVDHKQAARVINRKTDTFKFSDRLYKNVDELAVAFKSQMTRGIANNSGYTKIAKQLALESEASYKRALTIVRTEGGRVKSEAKLDSMHDAKKEGADIVKQWDSTFDGKTRPEHRLLDGQIREIDEPFKDSQGREAQAPHKFGVASMDINCRCIVLERARWAVEDEETPPPKHNNATGEDFIEAKDYKEWKEKAQKQLNEKKEKAFNKKKEELEKNGVKVFDKDTKNIPKKGDYFQTANKELVEIVDVSDYNGIKTATLADGQNVVLKNATEITIEKEVSPTIAGIEGIKKATDATNINNIVQKELEQYGVKKVDFNGMDIDLAKENAEQLIKLTKEYKTDLVEIRLNDTGEANAHVIRRGGKNAPCTLEYDAKHFAGRKGLSTNLKHAIDMEALCRVDDINIPIATTTHEFAHTIFSPKNAKKYGYDENIVKEIEGVKRRYKAKISSIWRDTADWDDAEKRVREIYISFYAEENLSEFMAEAFTNAKLSSNPSPYSVEVLQIIDKYFRR